jgi:chorismate mutase
MNLAEIRKDIDHLDHEILRLLSKGLELGLRARRFKDMIYDPDREEQIRRRRSSLTD